jgi:predicted metalloprotease
MEWRSGRRSVNVEDRRGAGGGMRMGGGALRVGGGIGGLGLVGILVVSWLLGIDPSMIIGAIDGGGGMSQAPMEESAPRQRSGGEDQLADFTKVVLGSTEDVWTKVFQADGQAYQEPRLVLFTDATNSACGFAQGATGPFYCPGDRQVYLDLGFFDELAQRFGAPGDFAQAYVIAHEVGHHVQNELGILGNAQREQQRLGGRTAEANRIQVRVELQADCLAGIWANRAQERLAPGDIEAALRTASAIGDDTLQRKSQGHVVPDSFTHGSSEQRQRWFYTGFKSGTVDNCNTFSPTAQL